MADASDHPEFGVELKLIGQSANNEESSPRKRKMQADHHPLQTTKRLNPGGPSMDMNLEFSDNYAQMQHAANIETDFFDTEEQPVVTTLEEQPKVSTRNKKTAYKLYTFYVLVLCLNLLISFDHGVLPAGAITIMGDLDLNYA